MITKALSHDTKKILLFGLFSIFLLAILVAIAICAGVYLRHSLKSQNTKFKLNTSSITKTKDTFMQLPQENIELSDMNNNDHIRDINLTLLNLMIMKHSDVFIAPTATTNSTFSPLDTSSYNTNAFAVSKTDRTATCNTGICIVCNAGSGQEPNHNIDDIIKLLLKTFNLTAHKTELDNGNIELYLNSKNPALSMQSLAESVHGMNGGNPIITTDSLSVIDHSSQKKALKQKHMSGRYYELSIDIAQLKDDIKNSEITPKGISYTRISRPAEIPEIIHEAPYQAVKYGDSKSHTRTIDPFASDDPGVVEPSSEKRNFSILVTTNHNNSKRTNHIFRFRSLNDPTDEPEIPRSCILPVIKHDHIPHVNMFTARENNPMKALTEWIHTPDVMASLPFLAQVKKANNNKHTSASLLAKNKSCTRQDKLKILQDIIEDRVSTEETEDSKKSTPADGSQSSTSKSKKKKETKKDKKSDDNNNYTLAAQSLITNPNAAFPVKIEVRKQIECKGIAPVTVKASKAKPSNKKTTSDKKKETDHAELSTKSIHKIVQFSKDHPRGFFNAQRYFSELSVEDKDKSVVVIKVVNTIESEGKNVELAYTQAIYSVSNNNLQVHLQLVNIIAHKLFYKNLGQYKDVSRADMPSVYSVHKESIEPHVSCLDRFRLGKEQELFDKDSFENTIPLELFITTVGYNFWSEFIGVLCNMLLINKNKEWIEEPNPKDSLLTEMLENSGIRDQNFYLLIDNMLSELIQAQENSTSTKVNKYLLCAKFLSTLSVSIKEYIQAHNIKNPDILVFLLSLMDTVTVATNNYGIYYKCNVPYISSICHNSACEIFEDNPSLLEIGQKHILDLQSTIFKDDLQTNPSFDKLKQRAESLNKRILQFHSYCAFKTEREPELVLVTASDTHDCWRRTANSDRDKAPAIGGRTRRTHFVPFYQYNGADTILRHEQNDNIKILAHSFTLLDHSMIYLSLIKTIVIEIFQLELQAMPDSEKHHNTSQAIKDLNETLDNLLNDQRVMECLTLHRNDAHYFTEEMFKEFEQIAKTANYDLDQTCLMGFRSHRTRLFKLFKDYEDMPDEPETLRQTLQRIKNDADNYNRVSASKVILPNNTQMYNDGAEFPTQNIRESKSSLITALKELKNNMSLSIQSQNKPDEPNEKEPQALLKESECNTTLVRPSSEGLPDFPVHAFPSTGIQIAMRSHVEFEATAHYELTTTDLTPLDPTPLKKSNKENISDTENLIKKCQSNKNTDYVLA